MPKGSLNRFGLVTLDWKRSLLPSHFISVQGGQQKEEMSDFTLSSLDRLNLGSVLHAQRSSHSSPVKFEGLRLIF
jgi:hypothetical protein